MMCTQVYEVYFVLRILTMISPNFFLSGPCLGRAEALNETGTEALVQVLLNQDFILVPRHQGSGNMAEALAVL